MGVFLSNGGTVFFFQKTDCTTKKVTVTFKFQSPPDPNEYPFQLNIISDSYHDLDYCIALRIPVHPAVEDDTEVHPEDAALDDAPTLQQMLFTQMDTGSDSEDEEDGEEEGEEEKKNGVDNEPDNEPFMKEIDPSEIQKDDGKGNEVQNSEESEETDDEGGDSKEPLTLKK